MTPKTLAFLCAGLSTLCACFASSGTETGNPPAIETALIGVGPGVVDGEVLVEGEAGAITPGGGQVTVRNESTGQETTVDVEADGSFSAELPGSVDDDYTVTASGPDGTSAATPIGDTDPPPAAGDWRTPHPCTGDEPSDPLTIDAYAIEGDTLQLTVSHGGGCAEHAYGLCWEDAWDLSAPPQNTVRVLHDAMGDTCEAYLTQDISFDLTPYREAYRELFDDGAAIEVNLQPCADCSVLYDFGCPADADSCPAGCRAIEARRVDLDAMCVTDVAEPIACLPEDAAQTDDIACAVRARDGAVFESPTGSLLGLGSGVWQPCDDTQATATGERCMP